MRFPAGRASFVGHMQVFTQCEVFRYFLQAHARSPPIRFLCGVKGKVQEEELDSCRAADERRSAQRDEGAGETEEGSPARFCMQECGSQFRLPLSSTLRSVS